MKAIVRYTTAVCILLSATFSPVRASTPSDSINSAQLNSSPLTAQGIEKEKSNPKSRSIYRNLIIPTIPMMVAGLIAPDHVVHSIRNQHLRHFRNRYDDFVQLAPLGMQLGMHIAGLEGHSSGSLQLLTADAIAGGLLAATVNSLKYTVERERPDATSHNSFPSGHTATAFMSAHLFAREYGDHYPLLKSLSYLSATSVGIGRVINNRHWAGDVLFGAGIGILSAELGYLLSDLIFSQEKPQIIWFDQSEDSDNSGIEVDLASLNIINGVFGLTGNGHSHINPISARIYYRLNPNWRVGTGIQPSIEQVKGLEQLTVSDRPQEEYQIKRLALLLHTDYDHHITSYWGIRASAGLGISLSGEFEFLNPRPVRIAYKALPTANLEVGSFFRFSPLFEPYVMLGFYHQPLRMKIFDTSTKPLYQDQRKDYSSGIHPILRLGFNIKY